MTDVVGAPGTLPRLLLRAVRYRYAGAAAFALDGIDLEILPGRVVGVAGANESGKTTLCLVAAGVAPAVVGGTLEGTVTIDGRPTTELRPPDLAVRCGVVLQDPAAQLSGTATTVFEEIAFGPRNLGLPLDEILARVEEALAIVAIEALADRHPNRLSGGQAQLVALASVLALRPAYLMLDEPTSQLDPSGTRLVADALARLATDRRTGILLVEHKTNVLERVADEVVVLHGGRFGLRGSTDEVLADARLAELGVEPPPRIRLRRAAEAAGVSDLLGRSIRLAETPAAWAAESDGR